MGRDTHDGDIAGSQYRQGRKHLDTPTTNARFRTQAFCIGVQKRSQASEALEQARGQTDALTHALAAAKDAATKATG